jgi:hypothetical protein
LTTIYLQIIISARINPRTLEINRRAIEKVHKEKEKVTTSVSLKSDIFKEERIWENNMDTWKPNCDILRRVEKS